MILNEVANLTTFSFSKVHLYDIYKNKDSEVPL